jgi:S1-C subfamily serine protease
MRLFTALLLLVASVTPVRAWDIDRMNEQIEKTSVIVSGICSGTVIDARRVLTAHHCVTNNMREVEKKEVNPDTGEITTKKIMERRPMYIEILRRQDYDVVSSVMYSAKIVVWDDKTDLAILEVSDLSWTPAMVAPLAPDSFKYKRGLVVFAVGNPGIAFENTVTTGIISAPAQAVDVVGQGNKIPYFQHSASIMGGSSGGAIYNDMGEIIGVVSAGVRGADIGLAVPVSKIRELVNRVPKPAEVKK